MRKFIPLSLVASLGLFSCQKEAKVAPVESPDETELELATLKAELTRLEHQLVSEQNDRLRKEAEQAAVFSELASVMKDLKENSKPQVIEIPVEKVGVPMVNEEDDQAEERRMARLKAEGEELAHLKTTTGDEYHDLVINRVTDIGVVFRHRGGIARIPFAELPVAWQDRFYYDRDRALLALKVEREAQARYDRAVEASLEEMEQKEARLGIDQSLQRLAGAVEGLQGQAIVHDQRPVAGGIIVNPPIIVHGNRFIQDDLYCPPVIHPPVVRTPVVGSSYLDVPTIRNGGSGRLQKPSLHQPTPLIPTPTTQRPASRVTGSSTAVSRSRPTNRPAIQTSTPSVQRPSSRSSVTATPVQRSRPSATVQRRSAPTPMPRSAPSRSRATTIRPAIRR